MPSAWHSGRLPGPVPSVRCATPAGLSGAGLAAVLFLVGPPSVTLPSWSLGSLSHPH